jgi:hypothetical protein
VQLATVQCHGVLEIVGSSRVVEVVVVVGQYYNTLTHVQLSRDSR